jgi:predicted nicotinamide N-methyase
MQVGAAAVTAVDVDPFAVAVIPRNARANDVRVSVVGHDILDSEAPDVDVVLAGDCWYEAGLAARVLPWLRRAQAAGVEIVVGDPDRRYLPVDALVELATYAVRTTTELEDLAQQCARVFALRAPAEVGVDVSSSSRRMP